MMSIKNKKELYLVSGFLGAGKTTFMSNLIKMFKSQKIAIVINEFGKQGIDGLLLSKEGISIREISNGSIFCNCRSDSFIDALVKISEIPVDIVLIESSGLSDPTGMSKILSMVQELTENSYEYIGNITIVDATNFEKLLSTAVAVKLQIASSDLVLINKIDLVDKGKLEKIENLIKEVNPLVSIKYTKYGLIKDRRWIENLNCKNSSGDINIAKKRIIGTQKILVSMEGNFSKELIRKWIEDFSDYFYRIKGFVRIEGKWHYIDGTSNQLEITKTDIMPDKGSLVILASGNQPVKKNMISSWQNYFNRDLVLL
ncbi:GTPase, G3E family [Maledivibacter halophilus]|uniref:GTPase, G3E family n=2 Tax=Maledivibacter halophilus TaxID=36842 RepID=A0A1T5IKQ2_9FIRM|nr:GTPase, G3E family [Maledivibacter halophilus]